MSEALAVIMPAYNEEDAIAEAVAEVQRHVLPRVDAALVVVDDGSRDGTGAILDRIASQDPRVRVIHQVNGGHGSALLTGLRETRSDFVLLLDSDRQIPLDDFPRWWQELAAGRDAVFGVRRLRHDPPIRLALTRVIRLAVRGLFGVRLADPNVPCKLFRRALWEEASPLIPPGTLAPSLFLAVFARARGWNVAEVDVHHRERATGEVSIKRWKLLRFCTDAFRQMLAFRRALRRDG
jgi:glycosyltransferase involved in cell wall biosynthesis